MSYKDGLEMPVTPRELARPGEPVLGSPHQRYVIEKSDTQTRGFYWSNGLCMTLRLKTEVWDSVYVVGMTTAKACTAVGRLRRRMELDGVHRRWSVRKEREGVRIWRVE